MSRNAGIIGGRRSANTTVAGGIWDLTSQQQERGASNWVLSPIFVEYLVVAGGGGGNSGGGGGGGAGGLLTGMLPLLPGAYTVTVGGGGVGAGSYPAGNYSSAANGQNSVFSSVTTIGGGRGGGQNDTASSGGSGGGASWRWPNGACDRILEKKAGTTEGSRRGFVSRRTPTESYPSPCPTCPDAGPRRGIRSRGRRGGTGTCGRNPGRPARWRGRPPGRAPASAVPPRGR